MWWPASLVDPATSPAPLIARAKVVVVPGANVVIDPLASRMYPWYVPSTSM